MHDYVNISSTLGVTHIAIFSQSSTSLNFRIGTLPRGPTISFKVMAYSTLSQITHIVKHPFEPTVYIYFILRKYHYQIHY